MNKIEANNLVNSFMGKKLFYVLMLYRLFL